MTFASSIAAVLSIRENRHENRHLRAAQAAQANLAAVCREASAVRAAYIRPTFAGSRELARSNRCIPPRSRSENSAGSSRS